jgi:hypothetical protein
MKRVLVPRFVASHPSTSMIDTLSNGDSAATCQRSPRIITASPERSGTRRMPAARCTRRSRAKSAQNSTDQCAEIAEFRMPDAAKDRAL